MPILPAIIVVLLGVSVVIADARDRIAGPISARVLKVQDGDTLIVLAKIWPGHEVKARVRIRGIDAPELKARCQQERFKAIAAKQMLKTLVSRGRISLGNVVRGKYYGRVLANVSDNNGADIAPTMLKSNLVRPYSGKRRKGWCDRKSAKLLP